MGLIDLPFGKDPWRKAVATVLDPVITSEVGVEVNTGKKWIDGSDIYQKIISVSPLPNTTLARTPHGITSVNIWISCRGIAQRADRTAIELPRANQTDNFTIDIFVDDTDINITTGFNYSAYTYAHVTLEYTKT